MVRAAKIVFVLLSVFLLVALCFVGAKLLREKKDGTATAAQSGAESALSSEAAESGAGEPSEISEPSATEPSAAESSEESAESSAAESGESSEEASGESSEAPPPPPPPPPPPAVPPSEPVTPPPASIATSKYDGYFNNSVFVGHSVMAHFKNFVSNRRNGGTQTVGNAVLCCTSSFSLFNNLNQKVSQPDNVLPRFRGQAYKIEDLPAATGADTVYIGLMGLNDLGMVGTPASCAREVTDEFAECVRLLREKKPDVKIAVLASTYLVRGTSYPKLNNRNMSLLNSYVLEYCNQNGIDFIDVATPLTDGAGYLAGVYCSDNYCHLKPVAYRVWLQVLYDYAERKANGTWRNPDSFKLFEG